MSDDVYSDETGDFVGVARQTKNELKYVAIPVNGMQTKLFDYRNQAVEWLTQHYNTSHM